MIRSIIKGFLGALAIFLFPVLLYSAPSVPFTFSKNGKVYKQLSVAEMKKTVGEARLKTIEPHDKKEVVYIGFDFSKLLTAVYGDEWKKMKKITFKCSDGFNPLVDPKLFLKQTSFLVYAKEGTADFTLKKDNDGGKIVDMSPYYLTWDISNAPQLNNVNNRPYQLVSIDLLF